LPVPCGAGFGAYAASKFALEALAGAYRFELSALGIDSVLVEPGITRTPILERFIGPVDQNRVAEYGPTAEAIERVKRVFEEVKNAPETPGADVVVEAFVRLIETPAGSDRLGPCPQWLSNRFWNPTTLLPQAYEMPSRMP